jgi:type II restriction enzyme
MSEDEFLSAFLDTITPGIIERKDFIDWEEILNEQKSYSEIIHVFEDLKDKDKKSIQSELKDILLAADNPFDIITVEFLLLGHTDNYFVSREDDLDIKEISKKIEKGDEEEAEYISELLIELGLNKILNTKSISDTFLGIKVGLETHKRKNIGGRAFTQLIKYFLNSDVKNKLIERGLFVNIKSEGKILYKDGGFKKVDFVIYYNNEIKIGIEVNFYVTIGSKPTEIKRSYAEVNRKLNEVGVELVWITDGRGYRNMRKSLKDAFKLHPNIYNYHMAQKYLADDIITFLKADT